MPETVLPVQGVDAGGTVHFKQAYQHRKLTLTTFVPHEPEQARHLQKNVPGLHCLIPDPIFFILFDDDFIHVIPLAHRRSFFAHRLCLTGNHQLSGAHR